MTTAKWEARIRKELVGKTIAKTRYMTAKECEDAMWDDRPLVIEFTDGSYIIPMSDDEGNSGGALSTSFDDMPVIPVMR